MDQNRQITAKERRSGADRRHMAIGFDFPFIDSHGHLVTEERRKSHRRGTTLQEFSSRSKKLDKQTA